MVKLAENRYGKSRVRLIRVKRQNAWHELYEWTVEIFLQGNFEACFVAGDNSKILPTDTMKNTVYSLARSTTALSMEDFAKELVSFLLHRNPQLSAAEVSIADIPWQHISSGDAVHPTAFIQSSREIQTTEVVGGRDGGLQVSSGLDHLVVLKTADSAFSGFMKDSLTTLAETRDRLFATSLRCHWTYNSAEGPFSEIRRKIRGLLLAAFADHRSESVQHTLYAMAQSVLAKVPEVQQIDLDMPNKHCLLVDLSPFGQDNPNEIFVPSDEPRGYIQASVCRE